MYVCVSVCSCEFASVCIHNYVFASFSVLKLCKKRRETFCFHLRKKKRNCTCMHAGTHKCTHTHAHACTHTHTYSDTHSSQHPLWHSSSHHTLWLSLSLYLPPFHPQLTAPHPPPPTPLDFPLPVPFPAITCTQEYSTLSNRLISFVHSLQTRAATRGDDKGLSVTKLHFTTELEKSIRLLLGTAVDAYR